MAEEGRLVRGKHPRTVDLKFQSELISSHARFLTSWSAWPQGHVHQSCLGGIELLHLSIEDHNNDVMEDSVIESASYVSNDFSVSCDEVVDCLSNGSWPPFITRDKNTISKKALSNPSFIDRSFQSVIAPSEVAVDPRSSTFFYPQGSKYLSRNFEPGLRLVARKILGDPNVPSGFISFSCDLSSTFQTDVPERSDPVFVFKRVGRRFVSSVFDLSQQPILTKFQGIGYINVLPSEFSPQVLPGSLYLFDSSSTIFRDDDSSNDSKRDDIQERLITKNPLPHIAFCWNDPDDVSHLTILNRF